MLCFSKKNRQKPQPRLQSNIKNRLGQGPTKNQHEKIRVWSPWIKGLEPKNYDDYKKFLVDQLRQPDDQDEEEGSSDTQTDENEAEEQE